MSKTIMGVYIIKNVINNKVYIGSTINIQKRWIEHKRTLNKDKHHNYHLQKTWIKYGKENFVFEILEVVSVENKLIEREQFWIDNYESYNILKGYNINPTAGSQLGRKLSDESKLQMRKSNHFTTPIIQIDTKGNYINEYPSIKQAVKETIYSNTSILNSLKNKTFFRGYAWVRKSEYYSNEFNINQYSNNTKGRLKEITKIDSFGNITIYKSISEASRVLHLSTKSIKKYCNGEVLQNILLDFKLKYVCDLEKE